MGRNMFGGHPGPWNAKNPWNGWWGKNPPFHHPVFVLTHHAREPLELEGGTTFTFVTGGIETALELALRAANGKDVSLAGGARAAQQHLAAGLVDEMEIHLVPTLLGSGERLFDDVGDLITWNCKHIANAKVRDKIEQVCRAKGYEPVIICTPEELLED
jgi:dihydrofolate reductase